ncbi:hypothetical protein, partial [Escherichia coli]
FCSLLAPSDAILFQEGVSVKLRLPQRDLIMSKTFTEIILIFSVFVFNYNESQITGAAVNLFIQL